METMSGGRRMRLLWIAVVLLGCVDERAVVQDDPLADPGLDALVGRVGVDAGGARRGPSWLARPS